MTNNTLTTATAIQHAIDSLGPTGGEIQLPSGEIILDRGIELRSNVTLRGQGTDTILKKAPGKIYPLSGYHNYGMCDVPVEDTTGLDVGMTVAIHDDTKHHGFGETFTRITWIDEGWVGLEKGIESDYIAKHNPCLVTVYPLVFGHFIKNAALKDLRIEGNQANDPTNMGGCRGGSVYFANARDITVENVVERDYYGEGLSFQMCRDMVIRNCEFSENHGNGLHPGAGSTNVLFENCIANNNRLAGFFFCVRATRVSVTGCTFDQNDVGISIGTRDCYNRIEHCTISDNKGPGIQTRNDPKPVEVHSCLINGCKLNNNANDHGNAQIKLSNHEHHLKFEYNIFTHASDIADLSLGESNSNLIFNANQWSGEPPSNPVDASIEDVLDTTWGMGEHDEDLFRHLSLPE